MSANPQTRPYRLYSAYCFQASPTYNAWVKLTAADVHALRNESDFQGQHLYFHLNHPVRYVRVVGVIVAIDYLTAKYTLLTIDDGSGATIELKIVRLVPVDSKSAKFVSETIIDNVRVNSSSGRFDVTVDNQRLDIGKVVKAKGTISEFRSTKQLELKRIWTVSTTNEEAQAWKETAAYKQDVLSKPWHLSASEGKKIKSKIRANKKKMQEYDKRKVEYRIKKEEQQEARRLYEARCEAKLEKRRHKEEIMMNAGALV